MKEYGIEREYSVYDRENTMSVVMKEYGIEREYCIYDREYYVCGHKGMG